MNVFFRWWASLCVVVALLAFGHIRFGLLDFFAEADNAPIIGAIAGMGLIASFGIGFCAWRIGHNKPMPNTSLLEYAAQAALPMGMIGTLWGFKYVLHHSDFTGSVDVMKATMGVLMKGFGTSIWSTITGLAVFLFLELQLTLLGADE